MSSSPSPGYDVFLSFRGEDTRKTVTSHLHRALVRSGISTFKDDMKIRLGDSIPQKLREAIESSRYAVVVISKRYATSKFCLDELQLIMELELKKEIGVVPVFYDVSPSDVRNHEGVFALRGHQSFKMMEKISKWKVALGRIGNQKGTESSKYKDDATMVEDIVKLISSRLLSMLPMDLGDIVGIKDHMEQINHLLDMDTNNDEVHMIVIWGMGCWDKLQEGSKLSLIK